jgi:hypothetical protein
VASWTPVLLLTPVAVGLVLGWLTGGRLQRVAEVRLRYLWLLFVAATAQLAQHLTVRWPAQQAMVVAVVLLWLGLNLRHQRRAVRVAVVLLLAGAALNGLAIAANGRMPYSVAAAATAGIHPRADGPKNAAAAPTAQLRALGDVIPVPPLRSVVSVGDLLIMAGAAGLVTTLMRPGREVNP